MDDPTVEPATWADAPAVRTVLARAYRDNPLMVWALPDAATREDACAAWLGPSVDRYLAGGRVHVVRLAGAVVGVAWWLPLLRRHSSPWELHLRPAQCANSSVAWVSSV